MVPGRPTMCRVITGRLHHVNNDLAIAYINPPLHAQMDFNAIRDTLAELLNVQVGMPFQSIQPCPFA